MRNILVDASASRLTSRGRVAALVVGAIASFAVFLDTTIVNLALPTLSHEFGANRSSVEWVIDAYTLAFGAIMLSAGVMSDGYGARRVFIPGATLFAIASIGCALAENMTILNVFRFIQGIGAAMLLPSSLRLATQYMNDVHSRRVAVGLWSAAGGVGMAAGPLVGGIVVTGLGWRWLFWINVLVSVVAITLALGLEPSSRQKRVSTDIFGQITATVMIGCLVFTLIEGPHLGWTAPLLMVAAVLCVVAIISFVIAERRTPGPLIPPRLAARPEFIGSAILGALFNLAFYGVLFALSLLLQGVKGESALNAGLRFLPLTGLIFVGNLIAPRMSHRLRTNSVLYMGQTLFAGGLLTTVYTAQLPQLWPLALSLLPMGLGAGILVPTMTTRMLESLPQDLSGAASGAFNTSRQLGGAIGVALFGTLLGPSAHLTAGFTECLVASFFCLVISAALTRFLMGGSRPRSNLPASK